MTVTKQKWGTLCNGQTANLYTASNGTMSFSATDYGCTLTGIFLPNKNGVFTDILLGFSTLQGYINSLSCFGSIIGRFANRISDAQFKIDGKTYQLDKNENAKNTLHSGFTRFDHFLWESKAIETEEGVGVQFTRCSADGEQGFPGNLTATVSYMLSRDNRLTLKYSAKTDKATPINFTNHAYFNLAGSGTILEHELQTDCQGYLEVDKNHIPTGKILSVKGTPFDFTTMKKIGANIHETEDGYDHCFVTPIYNGRDSGLPLDEKKLFRAAVLIEPKLKRKMYVETNQEGMQVYTANQIEGIIGKHGATYHNHEALCLETQCFPDTPNKAEFPPCILKPGEVYNAVTVYGFEF